MDEKKLKAALAKIKVEDITLDAEGRVVIANPDITADLVKGPGTLAAGDNYGCCTNGALCKKADLAEVMSEVERGRAGRLK